MQQFDPQNTRVRIQIEYLEMPGLRLTLEQVRRLCDVPGEVCDAAFSSLIRSGFLMQTRDGSFRRPVVGGSDETLSPSPLATAL